MSGVKQSVVGKACKTGRRFASRWLRAVLVLFAAYLLPAHGEDGYDLWLRYQAPSGVDIEPPKAIFMACPDPSRTLKIASEELRVAFAKMTKASVEQTQHVTNGAIVLASQDCQEYVGPDIVDFSSLDTDGYAIEPRWIDDKRVSIVAGESDAGALYGVFDFLFRTSRGEDTDVLWVRNAPAVRLRLLNHWDNLDRHVERGYAGQSIWDWHRLPGYIDPKYIDYARANASIGVNGVVLTNVNADATVLTAEYLEKVAALANTFRPYGIRVYLTARFSSPIELSGLPTADPEDSAVREWWHSKVTEIYDVIPDFGGFLVKANSEGQPGPQDYGRSHADGANMLAAALAPYGGHVMWRAFVYSADDREDRVKQAYREFTSLDGEFRPNVLVQVKNGPLDFQPREPFHPVFGGMPETPLMLELQITKEYLGFSTHLAYLGPLWEEVLQSDTFAHGRGSTVANVIEGNVHGYQRTGIAGVANIGSDRNWSGSIFDQANWFAFGRMAWNPNVSSESIAREWADLTFSAPRVQTETIVDMMMSSREAVVDYMTPLGLTHLMGTGHHYGPAPWVDNLGRDDWNPYYYHRATRDAIGIDRTSSGTNAVSQYFDPVREKWSDVSTTPDTLLLWFHRLPWDHPMKTDRTLWEELVHRYDRGVSSVKSSSTRWASVRPWVDEERFAQVEQFLKIQEAEAKWWRDASLSYWMSINGLELPETSKSPQLTLDEYKSMSFPHAPGQGG